MVKSKEIAICDECSQLLNLVIMSLTVSGLLQWSRFEDDEQPTFTAELDIEIRKGGDGYELVLSAFPDGPLLQRDPAGGALLSAGSEMVFSASANLCKKVEIASREQEKRTA